MYIGIDIGRSHTKSCSNPNNNLISFPSFCIPLSHTDLPTTPDITINQQPYLIGHNATTGSREFQKTKSIHPYLIPLLLYSIYQHSQTYSSPKLVLGLPISDYRTQAKTLESSIQSIYKVNNITIELHPHQILTFPEGAGAAWYLIFSSLYPSLSTQYFGLIDIGWKTINFLTLKNTIYDDSNSGTIPYGISRVFKSFYKRLSNTQDISLHDTELILQTQPTQAEPELKFLAQTISDHISMWWNTLSLSHIFLSGGGGILLQPYLPSSYELIPDAQNANAIGFYQIAKEQL